MALSIEVVTTIWSELESPLPMMGHLSDEFRDMRDEYGTFSELREIRRSPNIDKFGEYNATLLMLLLAAEGEELL